MGVKLVSASGGSVEINPPSTASNFTATMPAVTGNVVVDSATQTLTNKTLTTPNINSAQFATVSGTAPIYPCRAWVNFNGTGTVAIRASGNVSSITDNGGTGDYTINFTTAMPDADYSWNANNSRSSLSANFDVCVVLVSAPTTSALRIQTNTGSGSAVDSLYTTVAIFR
jgi:hypothetical protein